MHRLLWCVVLGTVVLVSGCAGDGGIPPQLAGRWAMVANVTFEFDLILDQTGGTITGTMVRTNGIEPDDPVTGTVTPDGRVTFVRERAGSWTQTYAGAVDATASPMTMSGLFNQDGGVVYVAWTAVFQVP